MWEVFVWVPTKGWKRISRTRSRKVAISRALDFVPLEVKLRDQNGRTWCSGQLHMPDQNVPAMTQIEELADQLLAQQ